MPEPKEPSDDAGARLGPTSRDRAGAPADLAPLTTLDEAKAWVSPRGAELLGWWATHHRFDALLVVAWGIWLLVQSQLAQQHAALPTSDGLTAGDWRLVSALGQHRLASGPLTWLLAATTAIWIAAGAWGARSNKAPRRVALIAATALALGGLVLALALAAVGEPPLRWQGVPGETPTSLVPLALENGRLLTAAGPAPRTRCRRDGDRLLCVGEGAAEVALDGRSATLSDGRIWRLFAATPATDAPAATLELGLPGAPQDSVAFAVRAGSATLVPALRARVAVEPSARSGPIAIVSRADAPAEWLAAPGWVAGSPAGRWRSLGAVRIEAAPALPTAIAVVALALLALLALAATVAKGRTSALAATQLTGRDMTNLTEAKDLGHLVGVADDHVANRADRTAR